MTDAGRPDVALSGRFRALGVCFLVAVVGFVASVPFGLAIVSALSLLGVPLTDVTVLFVSLLSLQGMAFPATAWAYIRIRGLDWSFVPVEWPTLREVGLAVGGFVLALVLVYGIGTALSALLDTGGAQNQAAVTARKNPGVIPYLLPLVFLFNAPGEELLFRGIIQGTFREHFGPAASIVLASLMFGPAHLTALIGSPRAILLSVTILTLPALVFGALYEVTDNLVVPSLSHGFYNATIFGLLYIAATSGDGGGTAAVIAAAP